MTPIKPTRTSLFVFSIVFLSFALTGCWNTGKAKRIDKEATDQALPTESQNDNNFLN